MATKKASTKKAASTEEQRPSVHRAYVALLDNLEVVEEESEGHELDLDRSITAQLRELERTERDECLALDDLTAGDSDYDASIVDELVERRKAISAASRERMSELRDNYATSLEDLRADDDAKICDAWRQFAADLAAALQQVDSPESIRAMRDELRLVGGALDGQGEF